MRRKEINLSYLIESFFTEYLLQQKKVSAHTISSYRDTFRLLLRYTAEAIQKHVTEVSLEDLNVDRILAFLNYLEKQRGCSARSRNQRLAAIKSFFKHSNVKVPDRSHLIHRVLSLSSKRTDDELVEYLTPEETKSLLLAPDRETWIGRRDHLLMLVAIDTGLRVSELTGVKRDDLTLDHHPEIYCLGKGRKERRTPLRSTTVTALREWLKEPKTEVHVFPNNKGTRMSPDSVQYLLTKYGEIAKKTCLSIATKRLSPHILRHTTAMNLLHAGVDSSVIALWFGHSSVETTTKVYLKASMKMKEASLQKLRPQDTRLKRYKPSKDILSYLEGL